MNTTRREYFTGIFPFWNKLSDQDKDLLLDNTYDAHYEKGMNVHSGSECTGAIIVKSGLLRVYLLSENGKDITLYRMYPGELCMLSATCVIKAITFDVSIDAETDSELLIIKGNTFADIAERNVYVENFALNSAVEKFSEVMWIMQQILFISFDKRLATFLYDETVKTGSNNIKLTHDQVAKYMGSAREVVSRMLKYFVSEGIVSLGRGDITIIDRKKLRDLCV